MTSFGGGGCLMSVAQCASYWKRIGKWNKKLMNVLKLLWVFHFPICSFQTSFLQNSQLLRKCSNFHKLNCKCRPNRVECETCECKNKSWSFKYSTFHLILSKSRCSTIIQPSLEQSFTLQKFRNTFCIATKVHRLHRNQITETLVWASNFEHIKQSTQSSFTPGNLFSFVQLKIFTRLCSHFSRFFFAQDGVGSFDHVSENIKALKRDSGVDLSEKLSVKVKNRKAAVEQSANGADVHFKSGMIFDLEM